MGDASHIQAVNRDAAAGDIVKPGNQLAQGALAAAGGAHNGNGLPGGHLQAHIVKHRQVSVIGKGHMVHGDLALYIFQGLCLLAVPDGGLGAHDLHKPVQPGKAIGEELRKGG